MQPLKFAPQRQLSPTELAQYNTDQTQALPLLRSLAAASPLAVSGEVHFRFIISVATQYCGRGVIWTDLLIAGYEALEKNLFQHDGQPEKVAEHLAWWVREGIVRAIENQ